MVEEKVFIEHIQAEQDYKNIKAGFEWKDIPKFAVITGENGSGKSNLLKGIKEYVFCINRDENGEFETEIKFFDKFKLGRHEVKSSYADKIKGSHKNLLEKYKNGSIKGWNNPFNWTRMSFPNLKFKDFIKRNFDDYKEYKREDLESKRRELNLDLYKKHFERNGMSEEKFYLSTRKEIDEWFNNLKDINFESKNVIFDVKMLLSIFGDYHTKYMNFFQNIKKQQPSDITIEEFDQKIEQKLGKNPLKTVNKLLQKAYSKYALFIDVVMSGKELKLQLVCKNSEGVSIPLNELSVGEQIIISLFMWRYNDKNIFKPLIFLLDEPDAHLNPKMSRILINTLKNIIVKEFDCQVLMTTHSLSTVAQCEDEDLFYMEDGQISQTTKEECVDRLADGVMTFEKAIDRLKMIQDSSKPILVVEGKTDKILFEKYYEKYRGTKPPFNIIDGCGANNLPQFYVCFNVIGLNQKRLFLFDYDEEGKGCQNNIQDRIKNNNKTSLAIFVKEPANSQDTLKIEIEDLFNCPSLKINQAKTKFAKQIFEYCSKEGIKDFEALVDRIENFFEINKDS